MRFFNTILLAILVPTLAFASYLGDPVVIKSGGTGLSTVPSAGQILVGNSGGTAYALQLMSGDATMAASGALTIANSAITSAKMANMAAHTYKGNNTGSTAAPTDVTATQLTADLNLFTSSLQGLTPSSGGGTTNFLRADGSWAVPPGTPMAGTGISVSGTQVSLSTPVTVANGGTGLASGTSGGIPYFSGTTTLASSAALSVHQVVLGGGAGASPVVVSGTGTSGQVLTSNGASADPTWQAAGGGSVGNSFIYVTQGNGYGGSSSGETHVRNFTNTAGSNGSDITYTLRDSTHGDKFTINTSGVYSICYTDTSTVSNMGLGLTVGIAAGDALLSGNPGSITYAQGFRGMVNVAASGSIAEMCRTLYLTATTVVRAMTDNASTSSNAANESFSITRVN